MTAHDIVNRLLEADPDDPRRVIDQLPERRKERWVFTDAELRTPELCTSNDEFIAFPVIEGGEQGVIVYRDGRVSSRWEDGTVGVPSEVMDAAGYVESLVAVGGQDYADNWRNVFVNEDDSFSDWAE